MSSLRVAFSAWRDILWVHVRSCHSWTRSSWLRTTKRAPPSSNPSRTEPSVKIWKCAGGMEARVLSESSLYMDGDNLLSAGVMTVGIRGGILHGGMKSCSQERGV